MRDINWDKHNGAILAEHIDTRGEDPACYLEFTRVQPRSLSDNHPDLPPYYNLAIVTEGEDMSFSQMTAREVCRVAEAMIRLVGNKHDAAAALREIVEAGREVISANKEFRAGMPADWEGDPLQDACNRLERALQVTIEPPHDPEMP